MASYSKRVRLLNAGFLCCVLVSLAMLGLAWTNPPDPDTAYIRFYAVRAGNPDTLKSELYPFAGTDEWGVFWQRSGPGLPDGCSFALPPGSYVIWCTALDSVFNESGQSNIISWGQDAYPPSAYYQNPIHPLRFAPRNRKPRR